MPIISMYFHYISVLVLQLHSGYNSQMNKNLIKSFSCCIKDNVADQVAPGAWRRGCLEGKLPVGEFTRRRGCLKERLSGIDVAHRRGCKDERLFEGEVARRRGCPKQKLPVGEVVWRRGCSEENLPRGEVAERKFCPRRLPGGGCSRKLRLMGRILSNISFVFWAMEFQEKMLLRFTDLQRRAAQLSNVQWFKVPNN